MKNLYLKEFRLALHPTNLIFLSFSAMLLIPNYPYYVTFFYTSLGIFFVCLSGRENNDIGYSLLLPVRKRDIVTSRILFTSTIQLAQAVVAIPFALLRQSFPLPGNQVGMDANIALFGFSFVMMGIFNAVFFPSYYAHPDKIGRSFAAASALMFLYMAVAEVLAHVVPFFRDVLDTPDTQYLPEKLALLAAGLAVYAALTLLSQKLSAASFEKLDI